MLKHDAGNLVQDRIQINTDGRAYQQPNLAQQDELLGCKGNGQPNQVEVLTDRGRTSYSGADPPP